MQVIQNRMAQRTAVADEDEDATMDDKNGGEKSTRQDGDAGNLSKKQKKKKKKARTLIHISKPTKP